MKCGLNTKYQLLSDLIYTAICIISPEISADNNIKTAEEITKWNHLWNEEDLLVLVADFLRRSAQTTLHEVYRSISSILWSKENQREQQNTPVREIGCSSA